MKTLQRLVLVTLGIAVLTATQTALAQMDGDHSGPTMNFYRIDDRLATGGHFVDGGLEAVKTQGVKVVIDLRDKPPAGQKDLLAAEGIEWISIPVAWKSPKNKDFEKFFEVMSEHDAENVLVQCQANYRASAMTYLYRVVSGSAPEAEARKAMNAVWEPEGTWLDYVDGVLAEYDQQ